MYRRNPEKNAGTADTDGNEPPVAVQIITCNLNRLSERLNYYFSRNGGQSHEIHYEIKFDADELFKIDTVVRMRGSKKEGGLDALGEGLKSIYILSLLQTYVDTKNTAPIYYYGRYTGNLSAPAVKKGCE